ncbi:hypothetical protein A0O34_07245 [Chryseobacterium glaciei]|uniref:Uncharacterized protein n=1 Tax=Chryseobacterium glaciei TaxID=1685010 RepID=A0A172XU01_9FLAO|nr:hypothetical protein [Chryseobacterium glaciei]ANF50322.1 hypothetical protein A0O34_07245 [Chryseobacterium glaciei]
MAIDKTIKKKVIEDWHLAFPHLSVYSQNKLYKVVGPVIIGLELIKLPRTEEYRPHFVIYPLWKENVQKTLDIPILLREYYNNKRLQFNIPYEKHSLFFEEVVDYISKQTFLSFVGNISLEKLLSVLDDYSRVPPLSAAPNSYLQGVLYQAKLYISLYVSSNAAENILQEIQMINWDLDHFKACGIDINNWILGLQHSIANRSDFLKQIEINKEDKKISKLQTSELIL